MVGKNECRPGAAGDSRRRYLAGQYDSRTGVLGNRTFLGFRMLLAHPPDRQIAPILEGHRKIINPQRLRRIFVRRQGVPAGAYFTYSPAGTTPEAGKKTSKIVDFIFSDGLISNC